MWNASTEIISTGRLAEMAYGWNAPSQKAGYPIPRCPHCGAAYFACKTNWRGICVKKPKS